MPERMNATGRVNSPNTNSAPPISSRTPAAPLIVLTDALFIGPAGNHRCFAVPCSNKRIPVTMRKILKSCADQGRRKVSIGASLFMLLIRHSPDDLWDLIEDSRRPVSPEANVLFKSDLVLALL